jgi:hypothetical protein
MGAERREHPDWANREREGDLNWISENLDVFQIAARLSYEGSGRGAIVIDVTSQAEPDTGHAFAYFSEEQVREYDDPDIARIVQGYDPEHEFVLVLLKSDDRTSTYRIRPVRGN